MSSKPQTAENFLLEMADDALLAVIGEIPASRQEAFDRLSQHVAGATGEEPSEDLLARVVDTLLAYELITYPVAEAA